MITLKHVIVAMAFGLLPTATSAAQWQVNPDNSQVHFDYVRDGETATGLFATFDGEGDFNAAAPESAELTIRIDSRSIDLKNKLASGFATSAEWFDSQNHQFITYRLTGLTKRADGRYDATGQLSLRGETKPVTAIIALDIDGSEATATGTVRVNRRDYLLGVGPSAVFVDIAPEVAVRFHLTARRAE